MEKAIEIKFVAMKNVDDRLAQVVVYEGDQEAGTLILTPEGWERFKEMARRTKIGCEG